MDFVWEVVREQNLYFVAETEQDVREQMTFAEGEPRGFHRFLDKFKILNEVRWTPELIDKSIAAVCRDLAADRIDYCWMDFSINKYMDYIEGWHKKDVVKLVHDCFAKHAPGKVGLLLSLKYESPRASQRQYGKLIEDVADLLIGVDLVGDESYFDAGFYADIFREWSNAGKITRAHVAESQRAENAMDAIERMGVREIAHGIKIHDRPEMLRRAKDSGVGFGLALTSNYMTGVWSNPKWHPVDALVAAGLEVTIGTDDPVQCGTTYDAEFELLHRVAPRWQIAERLIETAERRTREYGLIP